MRLPYLVNGMADLLEGKTNNLRSQLCPAKRTCSSVSPEHQPESKHAVHEQAAQLTFALIHASIDLP